MRNITKRITALILSLISVCAMVSCEESGSSSDKKKEPILDDVTVWSTYPTTKVVRNEKDLSDYAQFAATVDISLMKNETEGTQLVISPSENVEFYELKKSDLYDGEGNKITAEQIGIYHEKYVKIESKFSENPVIQAGDYVPDMLLPMETAVEYKENKIAAGENQSVMVEITTTSDTVPGEYRGEFTLEIDGGEMKIPVNVTVWDIEYEGRRSFQSAFLLYRDHLAIGEYDSSDEMVNTYIDFLLDYKINTWVIEDPYPTPETYVEEIKELFKNENYNSIIIPNYYPLSFTVYNGDGSVSTTARTLVDYVKAIAKISNEENMYIDYAYFYPTNIDEADQHSDKLEAALRILAENGEQEKLLKLAVQELESEGFFATVSSDLAEKIKQAILDIPIIFTNVGCEENILEGTDAASLCPYISLFDEGWMLDRYLDRVEKTGTELWTYTCIGPNHPYPSFHMDDNSLGTRVSGWIEKAYNVEGYLYWSLAKTNISGFAGWIDVYDTAARFQKANGDGYLMYPGKYYGSNTPFATIRLTAHRDSMDDYDMLCVYEKLLKERAEKYGISETFDFSAYVEDLYNSLFTGAVYYNKENLVYEAREELARRILELKNEDEMLIVSKKNGEETDVSVYTRSAILSVEGTALEGTNKGEYYTYSFTSKQSKTVKIETKDNEYLWNVYGYKNVTTFAEGNSNITVTKKSSYSIENDKLTTELQSVFANIEGLFDGATRRFTPSVSMQISNVAMVSDIYFTIENTGNTDLKAYVILCFGDLEVEISSFYCEKGKLRDVAIHIADTDLEDYDWTKLSAISLSFDNVRTTNEGKFELYGKRTFTVSNIYVK